MLRSSIYLDTYRWEKGKRGSVQITRSDQWSCGLEAAAEKQALPGPLASAKYRENNKYKKGKIANINLNCRTFGLGWIQEVHRPGEQCVCR